MTDQRHPTEAAAPPAWLPHAGRSRVPVMFLTQDDAAPRPANGRLTGLAALAGAIVLSACSTFDAGGSETVLRMQHAWVDGQKVAYVSTDVSDAAAARQNGVNHVPRLADALAGAGRASLVERVYKFPKGEQISIFPSAPRPAGGANTDTGYSPLWRLVMVTWVRPDRVRELRSEEELLAAQDRGELALRVTDIVANCPIVQAVDGSRLTGSR